MNDIIEDVNYYVTTIIDLYWMFRIIVYGENLNINV